MDTYSLAYCLPGRGLVVGYLYPRALPPVTHGSALQAPECMRGIIRGRILSRGQVFILVYRLAMDAKTLRGDGVGGLKYLSLLKDFLAVAASMARKRHLASSARGF